MKQIFVNLPVNDLEKSMAFFKALGYTFNPMFSDEKAGCMVISDTIYAMLLSKPYFAGFTKKEVADAHKTTEVLLALSCESKEEVVEMISKVKEAGGNPMEPVDHGFMYQNSYEDLDGHIWEIFWMDPNGVPQQ